ncbi:MAG: PDZ domain-containing protein [Myxococcota bacterium]|nr:PDZ domain-containing protein [Myxococcota bacterium]
MTLESESKTHFTVRVREPHKHLFHIEMELPPALLEQHEGQPLDLKMPVWSPGSYLIREYPRHVQNMRAIDGEGNPLPIHQLDKATWRLEAPAQTTNATVLYEVFSHELAVRTNHLDATHGSLNGVATYLYHEDLLAHPVEVTFDLPGHWKVYGGMEAIDEDALRYGVTDFDMLYDTPVELGDYEPLTFEVAGVPHQIVVWGEGNFDADRMVEDMRRSVQAHVDMFGTALPYDHYTFIVHLSDRGRGGLEHHNSTILLYPRDGFRDGEPGSEVDEDKFPQGTYLEYLRLVSHEHFHVWNVKRIRPEVLGPFDYQNENYTRDLWTVEGITCYYEIIGLLRAGVLDGKRILKALADSAKALSQVPGRRLHSLEISSLNAWVKLYRPDENTRNSSVSYYLKGELVSFLLDARIRSRSNGKHSLDDVLRALWNHYLETGEGYAEGSYGEWVKRVTGVDVEDFLDRYVRGTDELDFDTELEPFGLELVIERSDAARGAWLGANTKDEGGALIVTSTPTDGPAQEGGVYAGDELIAIDNRRVCAGELSKLLAKYAPGQEVSVHVARRGMLLEQRVVLGQKPADTWRFEVSESITAEQRVLLGDWLGLGAAE